MHAPLALALHRRRRGNEIYWLRFVTPSSYPLLVKVLTLAASLCNDSEFYPLGKRGPISFYNRTLFDVSATAVGPVGTREKSPAS